MGHKAGPVHGDLRAQIVSTTWTLGVAFLYFLTQNKKISAKLNHAMKMMVALLHFCAHVSGTWSETKNVSRIFFLSGHMKMCRFRIKLKIDQLEDFEKKLL